MVNSPDCFTSLFSGSPYLNLSANPEPSPMHYNNCIMHSHFTTYGRICTASAPIQIIQPIQQLK